MTDKCYMCNGKMETAVDEAVRRYMLFKAMETPAGYKDKETFFETAPKEEVSHYFTKVGQSCNSYLQGQGLHVSE